MIPLSPRQLGPAQNHPDLADSTPPRSQHDVVIPLSPRRLWLQIASLAYSLTRKQMAGRQHREPRIRHAMASNSSSGVPSHPKTDCGNATTTEPRMRHIMAVDTSSGVPSRPEIDGGEATKAEPGIRHTMASNNFSGISSRPEMDRGESTKGSPEYDIRWL